MPDYKDDLIIDKSNLDDECIAQPVLTDIYGRKEIYAEDDVVQAKDRLEATKARRELHYRSMSITELNEEFNLHLVKPPTEGLFSNLLAQDEEISAANQVHNEARVTHKLTKHIKINFENRSNSLTNLVKLHGQGYFSEIKGEGKNLVANGLKERLAAAIKDESERASEAVERRKADLPPAKKKKKKKATEPSTRVKK